MFPTRLTYVVFLMMLLEGLIVVTSGQAMPPSSLTAPQQGVAQRNEQAPWIAGWSLDNEPLNLSLILKRSEALGTRGVYVSLCGTWSSLCEESLRFLQSARGRLEREKIDLVIVFNEDISPKSLRAWLDKRGIAVTSRFHVIIDRYHRSALRLAAYEKIGGETGEQRLKLPFGLILSPKGIVHKLVTQEGTDLINLIVQTVRYSGDQ